MNAAMVIHIVAPLSADIDSVIGWNPLSLLRTVFACLRKNEVKQYE